MFLTYVHHGVFCFYSKKEQTCNKMNKLYTHTTNEQIIYNIEIYTTMYKVYTTQNMNNTKQTAHHRTSTRQTQYKIKQVSTLQ